eukprot:Cvel_29413.t1-p1 / transcript=Cvel_29413.t1 / gene=Cvel_29413 / organism=Chromera_velia_CCMP2878 / gene_product=hypothetical protein / transcript_product=hypothetical protein / location=Cvel_scaffold4015:1-2579(-) / protein_length=507 / sequence_SO=supercontig / SO=protein_coding / is_pseudo=false
MHAGSEPSARYSGEGGQKGVHDYLDMGKFASEIVATDFYSSEEITSWLRSNMQRGASWFGPRFGNQLLEEVFVTKKIHKTYRFIFHLSIPLYVCLSIVVVVMVCLESKPPRLLQFIGIFITPFHILGAAIPWVMRKSYHNSDPLTLPERRLSMSKERDAQKSTGANRDFLFSVGLFPHRSDREAEGEVPLWVSGQTSASAFSKEDREEFDRVFKVCCLCCLLDYIPVLVSTLCTSYGHSAMRSVGWWGGEAEMGVHGAEAGSLREGGEASDILSILLLTLFVVHWAPWQNFARGGVLLWGLTNSLLLIWGGTMGVTSRPLWRLLFLVFLIGAFMLGIGIREGNAQRRFALAFLMAKQQGRLRTLLERFAEMLGISAWEWDLRYTADEGLYQTTVLKYIVESLWSGERTGQSDHGSDTLMSEDSDEWESRSAVEGGGGAAGGGSAGVATLNGPKRGGEVETATNGLIMLEEEEGGEGSGQVSDFVISNGKGTSEKGKGGEEGPEQGGG